MKKSFLLFVSFWFFTVAYSQFGSVADWANIFRYNSDFKSLMASSGKVDAYVNIEKQSDGYFWTSLKLANRDTAYQNTTVYITLIYWKNVNNTPTKKTEFYSSQVSLSGGEIKLTTLPYLSMTNRPIIKDAYFVIGN